MKRLIITLAAAATAAGASAQQWGGLLMDKDLLMPTDMIELSQTQFNFGTARAMAIATGVILAVTALILIVIIALYGTLFFAMVSSYT